MKANLSMSFSCMGFDYIRSLRPWMIITSTQHSFQPICQCWETSMSFWGTSCWGICSQHMFSTLLALYLLEPHYTSMYFNYEMNSGWRRPLTVFLVALAFSGDWFRLFWVTYWIKWSMFNWWHTTLRLMSGILSGEMENKSLLVLRVIMISSSTKLGSLAPTFIVISGFSSSWTTMKSPSWSGHRISIVASIGRC